jgi:hypothetical protein
VVEKIQAQQAEPRLDMKDVRNLIVAARHGLRFLGGQDLVNVSLSVARCEALLNPAPAHESKEEPKNAG